MATVKAKWLVSQWLPLGIAVAAVTVPASAQRAPLFKSEILPVLEKNCVSCHGDQKKMAALDLSTFSGVMAGGASGPLIARQAGAKLTVEDDRNRQDADGWQADRRRKQLIKTYIELGRFPQEAVDAAQQAREAGRDYTASAQLVAVPKARQGPRPAVKNGS